MPFLFLGLRQIYPMLSMVCLQINSKELPSISCSYLSFSLSHLQPGMVTTDLLMSGATTKQAKFFINVLAEPAEVVAEYLVPNIRSIPANGSRKPTYIRFLTGIKAYSQIFSRLAFGARRNSCGTLRMEEKAIVWRGRKEF
ncbi:chlorophyll(ide) b reductase NOL, chloroplastic-like [Jatropha curcas]|uniref:chlorophyll(ide) b reductase NOL, chloroplastic-like n=1 Tax=Jatropha curcas TaxID=180498 RepID=UPI001894C0F9|nr:chlorophyll(ide) b reductase NOL, chloroplastic-like [Jatropha curcas]